MLAYLVCRGDGWNRILAEGAGFRSTTENRPEKLCSLQLSGLPAR
jgi:hypothetical protein